MEDLLQNIIKEASGKQLQNLKQAAQIAHGRTMNILRNNKLFMGPQLIIQISFSDNMACIGIHHMSCEACALLP